MVRLLQSNQTVDAQSMRRPFRANVWPCCARVRKTVRDPEFLARMEAVGLNIQPLPGAALEQEISRSMENVGEAARDLGQALKL